MGSLRKFLAVATCILAVSCGELSRSAPVSNDTQIDVDVQLQGLPNGQAVQLWEDTAADGGGYLRIRSLGMWSGTARVTVAPGRFIEAPIVEGGYGEEWEPLPRAQQVQAQPKMVRFTYQHEWMVTVGIWSRGSNAADFDTTGGTVAPSSGWFRDGAAADFVAAPSPGWRFAHWGVFDAGQTSTQDRDSGDSMTLHLTITKPLTVTAGFFVGAVRTARVTRRAVPLTTT